MTSRDPGSPGEAQATALRYLSVRDRTEREVEIHLKGRGFSPKAIGEVMGNLKRWGYLDDARVALQWGKGRMHRSQWGPARLARELHGRGIPGELAEEVIRTLMGGQDETALARSAAVRYLKAHPGAEGSKAVRRLSGYLGRRGFSGEAIRRILREYAKQEGALEGSEIG